MGFASFNYLGSQELSRLEAWGTDQTEFTSGKGFRHHVLYAETARSGSWCAVMMRIPSSRWSNAGVCHENLFTHRAQFSINITAHVAGSNRKNLRPSNPKRAVGRRLVA